MKWAIGVSTVPARLDTFLPRTLASLAAAGFDRPRLFVDGGDDPAPYWAYDVTTSMRGEPAVGNFANWYLGMAELYCRNPDADRFVMFEDDIILCRGVREYLEARPMPQNGYCNLYLGGERNEILSRQVVQGWFRSDQRAIGALGLMFDRATLIQLLGCENFVKHRIESNQGTMRVDGAACVALRCKANRIVSEFCHKPSLVQHCGSGASLLGHDRPAMSNCFPGEDFDVRTLLA